ncbi:MAG: hypothetical protein JNL89_10425 [Rhodanobacteraceae bacterium]|nr:hypothetical protein [Rhodanobacteraceae bacterium]
MCVVTVLAAGIDDVDAVDPPDNLAANYVFSFTPVNTRPVLTAGATLNYAENQAATAIDATITVADAEQANLVSASVQITTNYQNGADELACPGACGGLTASFAPASGTLTLSGTASLATYQTVLRSVSYRSTSENPSSAPRTVTWIGNDGIDPSLPVTSTINVTASNDPPVLTAGGTLNFIEGDPAGAIGAVTVTDPDDTNLVSATVTVSANFQTGADVLACGACGGLTASYTAPTLTISGSASLATYQAALSSVTFQNTSDAPSSLARTISYVGNDGDNNSAAVTGTVNIAALNDAPINSVPGAQVTNEDTNLVFSAGNGNLVSIADADVAAATLQVQLSVSNGTLTLSGTSGLSFTLGGGTGFSAITFTGTLANVNAALAGMAYVPTANYFGPAQLSITSNDQGNTGTGGALSDSDVVAITVNPVNDPPVATADSFDTLGNTELRIDLAAGVTPNIAASTGSATGVRHNDSDPVESDPFAVTGIVGCGDVVAPFDCTLASGSLLSMNANGSFRFRPSPTLASGAPTNDSFSYTITDAPAVGTAASANGTVTIRAYDKVWYVQQGAAGNGRSDSPLGSFTGIALGDGTDSDAPGDYIYVRAAGSSLSSSIVLEANQHLLGEGVALTTDRDLNGVTGTITLVPAGTLPTVSSGATSTVQITNAIPVEIRGLALGSGSGNAINLSGPAAAYTGSSTLTIANNQFTGATGDGIQVNTAATSLLSLAITDNAWLTSGAHGSNAVDIVNSSAIADSLRLDFSRNTNLNATSTAVLINGGAVARTTVTGFAGNSVHGNSAAAGVLLSNATFDATAGGTIQQVDGDALSVGQAGNGVGSVAATFSNLQGNLRFDDLDLYGIGGLSVSGTGSGLTFGVADPGSGGSATIDAATDFGVSANAVALDLRLAALTTASSASANVSLTAVTGQFGAAAGSAIVKSGGAAAAFVVGNSNLTTPAA